MELQVFFHLGTKAIRRNGLGVGAGQQAGDAVHAFRGGLARGDNTRVHIGQHNSCVRHCCACDISDKAGDRGGRVLCFDDS